METQLKWKKVNTDIGRHNVRFYAADIPEHLQVKYGKQVTIHMSLNRMAMTNKYKFWTTMVDGKETLENCIGFNLLRDSQRCAQNSIDNNFTSII